MPVAWYPTQQVDLGKLVLNLLAIAFTVFGIFDLVYISLLTDFVISAETKIVLL